MTHEDQLSKIEAAIAAQESLLGQGILPDEQIEATLALLRTQRDSYLARAEGGSGLFCSPEAHA